VQKQIFLWRIFKMKKVLAIALALTLMLSISAFAFAAGSPTGGGSTSNVPVDTTEFVYGPATPAATTVVTRAVAKDGTETVTLTEEQEKQVDTAIDNAIKEGNAVVEAVYVDVPADVSESNPATVVVELAENEVILLYSLDGRLLKTLTVKDLVSKDGGFEVNITESCILVIAKK
jgi:ABC-type glycerol-3-phosphate transport system substrate-binding protein